VRFMWWTLRHGFSVCGSNPAALGQIVEFSTIVWNCNSLQHWDHPVAAVNDIVAICITVPTSAEELQTRTGIMMLIVSSNLSTIFQFHIFYIHWRRAFVLFLEASSLSLAIYITVKKSVCFLFSIHSHAVAPTKTKSGITSRISLARV
jgi:hypothetical protein